MEERHLARYTAADREKVRSILKEMVEADEDN